MINIEIPDSVLFPAIRTNSFYDEDDENARVVASGFFQSPNYNWGYDIDYGDDDVRTSENKKDK